MAKKTQKKKIVKTPKAKAQRKNTNRIKAILMLCVSCFFFAYMIYSGGSIGSFFSLIIGLVCGLIGVLYLREGKKGG